MKIDREKLIKLIKEGKTKLNFHVLGNRVEWYEPIEGINFTMFEGSEEFKVSEFLTYDKLEVAREAFKTLLDELKRLNTIIIED